MIFRTFPNFNIVKMASTRRDATATPSTWPSESFRAGRDVNNYRRREARELFAETASGLGGFCAENTDGS